MILSQFFLHLSPYCDFGPTAAIRSKMIPFENFFAHIFKSIERILKKLRAKMCFFTFSKMVKNTTMTRKNHLRNHWCYEFFSIFGFGFKHSIAIFSAIQNVIWSKIDDFRTFWKLRDFPFLTCFLMHFFHVFSM